MRLLLIASLALPALAQSPPCLSLNDSTTNVGTSTTAFGFAGPNTWAYQFQATSTGLILAGQLFTGNTQFAPGFMTLELWSNDPVSNTPSTRLTGGTWQIEPTLGVTWQGANFDQLVLLSQGTDYWLVWTDPGGSRLPYEAGGVTMPAVRRSGANWLALAAQPVKWRLFCNYLDNTGITTAGFACAAANGRLGVAFSNGIPTTGNAAFRIEGSGFGSGSLAVLAVGWDPNWVGQPIPGTPPNCEQHTDVLASTFGLTGTGNVRSTLLVGAAGHVGFPFAIPSNPGLIGVFLSTQIAGFDAANTAPIPFTFSNAVRFVVQ
jgi:hypothetical protein